MRRFEFKDGASNKFWEIALSGEKYDVRYGRIGTDGQSVKKSFATKALALAAHDKIIAEKVKGGYLETSKKGAAAHASPAPKRPAPAVSKKVPQAIPKEAAAGGVVRERASLTKKAPQAVSKEAAAGLMVRDRASFEKAFGPIKKLAAANRRLRECRLPGPDYYDPDMSATPPMFTTRLWNTGFHPEGGDGTAILDWKALGEAVAIAHEIASTLNGVCISSDTDCDFYPFVFPTPFDGKAVANHVYAGMGCKTKSPKDFEVEKTKATENFFWDDDDEAEEYYSSKELVKCRKAAELFRKLDRPVKIGMKDSFVTYPLLLAGLTKSGYLAGVLGIRIDT